MSYSVMELLEKVEKAAAYLCRRALCRGNITTNLPVMNGEDVNRYIADTLASDAPAMIARFGTTEMENITCCTVQNNSRFRNFGLYATGRINYLKATDAVREKVFSRLCTCSGFFPDDIHLLDKFYETMLASAKIMDCCGIFGQNHEEILSPVLPEDIRWCRLEDLEPYDYPDPWSRALRGRKVLVIHPFEESIRSQYARRGLLWDNPDVLPEFELKTIRAVQSIAGEQVPYADWFEALEHMESQMDAIDYDVAIIGCGAYGMPLAAHAKRTGHKAVHLGGATQILFGIKGKRWDNLPAVSRFYNEHWEYPLPEETPKNNSRVEGGCYW